jgi:sulfhydrogenase subunit alpha
VGGLSSYPGHEALKPLLEQLEQCQLLARETCNLLLGFKCPVPTTQQPSYLALIPENGKYGFFGNEILSSDGWSKSIQEYRDYLNEISVPYSHAKKSQGTGKPLMVGAMARLRLFGDRLGDEAKEFYGNSPLASGDTNTIWNNFAQSIEVVEAIDQAIGICKKLIIDGSKGDRPTSHSLVVKAGQAVGAVECPRGTLYHYYSIDDKGKILAADLITPSAQNTARIESDIREVVNLTRDQDAATMQNNLETLVRAYDPCNTCATHMVSVQYHAPPSG